MASNKPSLSVVNDEYKTAEEMIEVCYKAERDTGFDASWAHNMQNVIENYTMLTSSQYNSLVKHYKGALKWLR